MLHLFLACNEPLVSSAVTPPAVQPPKAPAALSTPEVEDAPSDPRLMEVFTAQQRAAIAAQSESFHAISSIEEFAETFRASKVMASNLSDSLQRRYEAVQDSDEFANMDLAWLKPLLPGMEEAYFAEGTALQLVLIPASWLERAAATPQPDDDAFLAFMALSYDNPGAVGWPTWNVRTWDYGGCSGLGSGVYVGTLKAADTALADSTLFEAEIMAVRSRLISDLLATRSTFEWCSPETGEPTPVEALLTEGRAILQDAKLSAEEKAQLQERIDASFKLDAG
ncbi:MAG: hypothetical protein P8R54_05290 [Myxococcota bacterium]|nr:hypothetical protein [Myxococcota bacterium]